MIDGESVSFSQDIGEIHFLHPICVRKGQTLQLTLPTPKYVGGDVELG